MTTEQMAYWREAGRKACANLAQSLNAGNANEFAATSLAQFIAMPRINGVSGVQHCMQRGRVDLSTMLGLDENEFSIAAACFSGGCYEWLESHPD